MKNKIIEISLVGLVPGLIALVVLMAILPTESGLVVFGIASSILISLIIYVHRLPNPTPEDFISDGSEFKIQNDEAVN